MKESQFNRWFNAFILGGMTVALVLVTCIKFRQAETGRWLLLVSAIGSLAGVLSSVTSANGRIVTFVFGLIDVSLYAVMCFIGAKYGNAVLHVLYFVPMQFVGLAQWRKRDADSTSRVKARRLTPRQRFAVGAALVLGSAVMWLILHGLGHSDTPFFDALSVVCNIMGQLLMSLAFMEQWIFWIGVNVASILMWSLSLAGDVTSSYAVIYVIKYSFYLVNSFNGLRIWLQLSRNAEVLE